MTIVKTLIGVKHVSLLSKRLLRSNMYHYCQSLSRGKHVVVVVEEVVVVVVVCVGGGCGGCSSRSRSSIKICHDKNETKSNS